MILIVAACKKGQSRIDNIFTQVKQVAMMKVKQVILERYIAGVVAILFHDSDIYFFSKGHNITQWEPDTSILGNI